MDDPRVVERAVLRLSRRVYAALSASPSDLDSYQAVWANSAARSVTVVAPLLAAWARMISTVPPQSPDGTDAPRVWALHATRLVLAAQHGDEQRLYEAVTDAFLTLDDAGMTGLLLDMGTSFTAAVDTCGGLTLLENANGLFDGIAATDRERELVYDAGIVTTAIANGNPAAARHALGVGVVRSGDPQAYLARLLGVLVRTAALIHRETSAFFPAVDDIMTLPGGLDDTMMALVQKSVLTTTTGDHHDNVRMAKRLANLDVNGLTAAAWYLAVAIGTNLAAHIASIHEAPHDRRTRP